MKSSYNPAVSRLFHRDHGYDALRQQLTKSLATLGGAGSAVYTQGTAAGPVTYAPNGAVLNDRDLSVNTYDDIGRILTGTQVTHPFEYDRYGNRTKEGAQQNLSYDVNNRIASGNGVGYDALGNIISETTPSWSYSYDAENRLISATGANGESYVYDAIGRRVKLINNGGVRLYFYDLGGHAMTATDSGGNRLRSEIYLGGMHLATYANSKTYFSHTNLIGTTRVITDEQGAVNNDCTYWPFGDWQSCSNGTPITPIGYAGYEHDPETGLDHTWFRYYNPRIGRFMSADPLGGNIGDPQSLNRFAYVNNDPANMFDPLGLREHPRSAMPQQSGHCTLQGMDMPCSLVNGLISNGSALQCPFNDCSVLNWTFTGNNGVGSYKLIAGQNGWTWLNTNNGEELSESAAEEIGLFTDSDGLPSNVQFLGSGDRGGGGPRRGERRRAAKPSGTPNPMKHARPSTTHPGQWEVKDPHTGKWTLKAPGWKPTQDFSITPGLPIFLPPVETVPAIPPPSPGIIS